MFGHLFQNMAQAAGAGPNARPMMQQEVPAAAVRQRARVGLVKVWVQEARFRGQRTSSERRDAQLQGFEWQRVRLVEGSVDR